MTRYVFIESRDPFESRDTQFLEDTAIAVMLAFEAGIAVASMAAPGWA